MRMKGITDTLSACFGFDEQTSSTNKPHRACIGFKIRVY